MEIMTTGQAKKNSSPALDILGYTSKKDSALAGTGMTLQELANLRNLLCIPTDQVQFSIDVNCMSIQ